MPEVYRGLEHALCPHFDPGAGATGPRSTGPRGANPGCASKRAGAKPIAVVGLEAGWLIAKKPDAADAESFDATPRCLQLATGQWCLPNWATWFPSPGPAVVYASDLGYRIGKSVEIIYLQRDRQTITTPFWQS
ncbi:hypothetical protein Enr13x_16750 [Stieleria neptunia]|uniref:Uncharacterized protein n=1 Tax=Stieleria neptunia TaxID=2527979 RepID=A0A518HLU9_9BACT|nr:hypothetical protein [Stieleria neptunia]QDV41832.1 hypothetical protein Enr13x_16750 [Stieleria neptunia]